MKKIIIIILSLLTIFLSLNSIAYLQLKQMKKETKKLFENKEK